jgi:hypothetical protein
MAKLTFFSPCTLQRESVFRDILLPTNELLPAIQATHLLLSPGFSIIMFDVMDAFVCIQSREMNNISFPPQLDRIIQLPFFCVCRYVAALKVKSQKQNLWYHFRPIPSGSMGVTDFSEPFQGQMAKNQPKQ